MRRSRYVGVALIGLLVVAAISVAAGSGRKPAKELGATASLRRLSGSEVMAIVDRFPEMVPSYFASKKNDTGFIRDLFSFSEVRAAPLEHAFPAVRFYKGLDSKTSPPYPYLMAIAGNKRYMLPGNFNRMLVENRQKVTDENIVELAQAFVLLAVGSEPISNLEHGFDPGSLDSLPPIAFLEAKRIKQEISGITFDAKLKVRVGERVEDWHFAAWHGQLMLGSRGTTDGKLIKQYDLPMAEPLPQRGQLDYMPTLTLTIDTFPDGAAHRELDDSLRAHYYLTVERNGTATGDSVRFSLSGFPPNATNVYIRVTDTIRSATRGCPDPS